MVSGTISLPCSGFFSPFLHSTRSLSVSREYLALPDGPGWFRQGSTCLVVLRILLGFVGISSTGFAPSSTGLSMPFDYSFSFHVAVLLPQSLDWFGLFQFRSPLLSESLLFSFPPGTKMFQFPGFSSLKLCIGLRIAPHYWYWVAPFGYPRIVAYLRLPEAFRC